MASKTDKSNGNGGTERICGLVVADGNRARFLAPTDRHEYPTVLEMTAADFEELGRPAQVVVTVRAA